MSTGSYFQDECLELFTEIVAAYPLPQEVATYQIPYNVIQDTFRVADITLSFKDVKGVSHTSLTDGGSKPTTLDSLKAVLPYLRHFRMDGAMGSGNYSDFAIMADDKLSVHSLTKRKLSGLYFLVTLSANTYDDPLKLTQMQRAITSGSHFDVIFEDENGRLYLSRTTYPCAKMNVTFNLPRDKRSTVEITLTSVNPLMPITADNA